MFPLLPLRVFTPRGWLPSTQTSLPMLHLNTWISLASLHEHFDLSLASTLVLCTTNSFLDPSLHDLDILIVHFPNLTSRHSLMYIAFHYHHDIGFQSLQPIAFIFPCFCERRVFEFQRWWLYWLILALTLVHLVHSLVQIVP
jgi:hypothetical protein